MSARAIHMVVSAVLSAVIGVAVAAPRPAEARNSPSRIQKARQIRKLRREIRDTQARVSSALGVYQRGEAPVLGGEVFVGGRAACLGLVGGDAGLMAMRDSFGMVKIGLRFSPQAGVGLASGSWARAGVRCFENTTERGGTMASGRGRRGTFNVALVSGLGGGLELGAGRNERDMSVYLAAGAGFEVSMALGHDQRHIAPSRFRGLSFKCAGLKRAEQAESLVAKARELLRPKMSEGDMNRAHGKLAHAAELIQ